MPRITGQVLDPSLAVKCDAVRNKNKNTWIQCDRILLEELATSRSFTGYFTTLMEIKIELPEICLLSVPFHVR